MSHLFAAKMPTVELAPLFLAHVPESLRDDLRSLPDLEVRVRECFHAAKEAWPNVELPADRYVAHLASKLPDRIDVSDPFEPMATDDIYLACACAAGDADAVRAFTDAYLHTIRAVIGRTAHQAVDDITQRVLANLLTGDTPAIRTFGGRSSLRSWLRVVSTRAVYAHTKRERRHVGDDLDAIVERLDAKTDNPEIDQLKKRYRAEFKRGFAHAFATLSVRARNLLRHEHLDDLGVGEIAALYGVHRATVTRWRSDARASLLSETRRFFGDEVKIDGDEFKSVMRLIESQLDVSLTRLLRGDLGKQEKGPGELP